MRAFRPGRAQAATSGGTPRRPMRFGLRKHLEMERNMFEKLRIKEHMEVADSNGQHVGTVDEVADDHIKLTRSDSSDQRHHFIALDAVDRIDDNRVYLKQGTPLPASA